MCHVSCFRCNMSAVTCHMSLTPTATATAMAALPALTIHSRMLLLILTNIHQEWVAKKKRKKEEEKSDIWQVTCDMWHATSDIWHLTCYTWYVAKKDKKYGATIRIHWEIQCLPYAFFCLKRGIFRNFSF